MNEYRFYFNFEGLHGYITCHAATEQDASIIFNLLGAHDGLGSVMEVDSGRWGHEGR